MYQRKVDVDMFNAVKSDSLSRYLERALCSDEGEHSIRQPTHSLRRSAYPHKPYVDTFYVFTLRRRRPQLVLTGTSIPFYGIVLFLLASSFFPVSGKQYAPFFRLN